MQAVIPIKLGGRYVISLDAADDFLARQEETHDTWENHFSWEEGDGSIPLSHATRYRQVKESRNRLGERDCFYKRSGLEKRSRITLQRKDRELVRGLWGDVCAYCSCACESGHIDHIVPLSLGGSNALWNLCWSCADCNHAKRDRDNAPARVRRKAVQLAASVEADDRFQKLFWGSWAKDCLKPK